jgi:hypothetical protein
MYIYTHTHTHTHKHTHTHYTPRSQRLVEVLINVEENLAIREILGHELAYSKLLVIFRHGGRRHLLDRSHQSRIAELALSSACLGARA